jgi:hypothetical protein
MRLMLTILVLGVVPLVLLRKMGRNCGPRPTCTCKAGSTSA